MARQNLEVMKAGFAAWNAGDMEAFRELFHSDVIMQTPEGWPEPGPLVGREAVMRQFHAEALAALGLPEQDAHG